MVLAPADLFSVGSCVMSAQLRNVRSPMAPALAAQRPKPNSLFKPEKGHIMAQAIRQAKPGDRVKITLKKHITEGWTGVIELAYYQAGVNSNVYGVRFGEKRQLYNRYFEFDLEKVGTPSAAAAKTAGTGKP